jgi:folate-dependent tRNA-U54 methylase TrmFO/GidA
MSNAADHLLAVLEDELLVLIAIAKSDNRMVRNERDIIVRYAEERAKDKKLAFGETTAEALNGWIKKQDPTTSELPAMLQRIAQTGNDGLQAMLEVTEIVAEMDDKIKPGEARQLDDARRLIQSMMGTKTNLL